MAGKGADVEDTCQLGGADVLMMKVMEVKGQVTVNLFLQVALVQVKAFVLLVVVLKVFVVEELLLFSLSSRTRPSTRPAARCLGFWG